MDIITQSDHVDQLLEPWQETIGDDLPAYRNHILRVLNFTIWHLGGDQSQRPLLEAALVYHDLGLWSDHDLAYLEPSSARALKANAEQEWGFDPHLLEALIVWHHKITPYRGPHDALINALRRADWADFTYGATRGKFALRKGLPRSVLEEVVATIPWLNFFDRLDLFMDELTGGRLMVKLTKLNKLYRK